MRVAVLTVSDTRTVDTDTSGAYICDALGAAGHSIAHYAICRDEPSDVRLKVAAWLPKDAEVLITTGGTGIGARDSTYEAIDSLIEKRLEGFGELFRMLSYGEVGSAAMMSRATAGTVAGGGVVIALPGSLNAVTLAMAKLILPELAHLAKLGRRAP